MWPHSRRPQVLHHENNLTTDQNAQFVFKPLLYELINGGATPEEVAPLFADLLAPMNSTSFIQVMHIKQHGFPLLLAAALTEDLLLWHAGQCAFSTHR